MRNVFVWVYTYVIHSKKDIEQEFSTCIAMSSFSCDTEGMKLLERKAKRRPISEEGHTHEATEKGITPFPPPPITMTKCKKSRVQNIL